jgi:hypothetical protein
MSGYQDQPWATNRDKMVRVPVVPMSEREGPMTDEDLFANAKLMAEVCGREAWELEQRSLERRAVAFKYLAEMDRLRQKIEKKHGAQDSGNALMDPPALIED